MTTCDLCEREASGHRGTPRQRREGGGVPLCTYHLATAATTAGGTRPGWATLSRTVVKHCATRAWTGRSTTSEPTMTAGGPGHRSRLDHSPG